MRKRQSGKASAAKSAQKLAPKKTESNSLHHSKSSSDLKSMEKRLALMGYVRGKDWSVELIKSLHETEQALVRCSDAMKSLPTLSAEETQLFEQLQVLEIQRFQLLGQLYGNRVTDYHVLIS